MVSVSLLNSLKLSSLERRSNLKNFWEFIAVCVELNQINFNFGKYTVLNLKK